MKKHLRFLEVYSWQFGRPATFIFFIFGALAPETYCANLRTKSNKYEGSGMATP